METIFFSALYGSQRGFEEDGPFSPVVAKVYDTIGSHCPTVQPPGLLGPVNNYSISQLGKGITRINVVLE